MSSDATRASAPPTGFNVKRGLRNAGWLVGGNYASYLLSAITVVVVARPLGPSGYGLVSAVLAFIGVLSWTALTGFDRVVVRSAVREAERLEKLVNLTWGLKSVIGAAAVVAILVAAWVVPGLSQAERIGISIASVTLVISPMIGTLSTVFQVHEQMQWMPLVGLARQVVYIVGAGGLIVVFGAKPLVVVIAFVVAYAVALVLTQTLASRWMKPRVDFRFKELDPAFVKAGALFTYIGFFSFLYTKVDILMIRWMSDLTQVGLYAAALTLFSRLSSTTDLFSIAFFPQIVREAKAGKLVLADMWRGVVALAAIGAAVAGLGALVAPWIVPFVLGKAFAGSVEPFVWLLVALAVSMPFYPLILLFQARGKEATLAKIVPMRAVLNVAIDAFVLSRGWGISAVAVGTLVTSLIYYAVLAIVAARHGMLVSDGQEVAP
jgi:O-antigen/teichoic acid export membrane protein